jgi:hypothetical protein
MMQPYGKALLITEDRRHIVLLSSKEQFKNLRSASSFNFLSAQTTDNYQIGTFRFRSSATIIHYFVPLFGKEDLERDKFWKQRVNNPRLTSGVVHLFGRRIWARIPDATSNRPTKTRAEAKDSIKQIRRMAHTISHRGL